MDKEKINKMIESALKTRENSYSPYSHFKVGAAVLTKDGKIFSGCNVENSAYPTGICAERNAVSSAVAAGYREFEAIAIAAGDSPTYPCGECRQFLSEFGDMTVICSDKNGEYRIEMLSELLPKGFILFSH